MGLGLFSMEERRFRGDFFAAFQGELMKRRKRGFLYRQIVPGQERKV